MSNNQSLERIFKCLAVDARIQIIRMLNGRVLCVGALASRLSITPGAVSQHLRILRDAGLVVPEKRANFVHYRLDQDTMSRWREEIDGLLSPAEGLEPCLMPFEQLKGDKDV